MKLLIEENKNAEGKPYLLTTLSIAKREPDFGYIETYDSAYEYETQELKKENLIKMAKAILTFYGVETKQ